MRIAALYDVHGMADALEAVLAEVDRERVDAILLGGDVAAGPQPVEVLDRLRALDTPLRWVRGNGDRVAGDDDPSSVRADRVEVVHWTRGRMSDEDAAFLGSLPERVVLDVDGLGGVLFCHATPWSDVELVTEATPDAHLLALLEGVEERVVVSGHTHMQFDRRVDGRRWINAGSVGMPYEGEVAAFWALLGPGVELCRTPFDVERAARAILRSGWPEAESFVRENLRAAVPRSEVVPLFERLAVERGERGARRRW
jgi:putative phosphoesterase